ncbi:MAG: hypothetical protein ACLUOI_15245 [Eisenbergiella sp.]
MLGVAQMVHFLEGGMDELSGFPYHGFNSDTGMKYGIIGWGRAVGWLTSGMSESPLISGKHRSSVYQGTFQRTAEETVKYQRKDGSFAWQPQALEGPADTSATATLLCAAERHAVR